MPHFLEQLVHWSIESDTAAPIIKPCTAHTVVLNIWSYEHMSIYTLQRKRRVCLVMKKLQKLGTAFLLEIMIIVEPPNWVSWKWAIKGKHISTEDLLWLLNSLSLNVNIFLCASNKVILEILVDLNLCGAQVHASHTFCRNGTLDLHFKGFFFIGHISKVVGSWL